jgi:hypothetical protein
MERGTIDAEPDCGGKPDPESLKTLGDEKESRDR